MVEGGALREWLQQRRAVVTRAKLAAAAAADQPAGALQLNFLHLRRCRAPRCSLRAAERPPPMPIRQPRIAPRLDLATPPPPNARSPAHTKTDHRRSHAAHRNSSEKLHVGPTQSGRGCWSEKMASAHARKDHARCPASRSSKPPPRRRPRSPPPSPPIICAAIASPHQT